MKIGLAAREHPRVQLPERADIWDRDEVTAAETPDLSLDPTLFVGALDPGGRELRLIKIVRAQRDKPVRLDTPAVAQHLLDHTREIVITQQAKHATKPVKRVHVSLEERLLGAVREHHRERRTRMTRTHVKQVDLAADPAIATCASPQSTPASTPAPCTCATNAWTPSPRSARRS